MSEPPPIYTTVGEQLDPATVEALRLTYEALRADGISIVVTAERGLRDLGVPVQSAFRSKGARQNGNG